MAERLTNREKAERLTWRIMSLRAKKEALQERIYALEAERRALGGDG